MFEFHIARQPEDSSHNLMSFDMKWINPTAEMYIWDIKKEIYEWLKDNIEIWFVYAPITREKGYWSFDKIILRFDNESDALLFKLSHM